MPIAKVDSKSFNYAKQTDRFLRLSSPSVSHKQSSPVSPTQLATDYPDSSVPFDDSQIWKDLTSSQDSVSSYIICLIAKLISLDSGQSTRPLPEVYKEITEMQVDINQYRQWTTKEKPLHQSIKVKALSFQHAIISTIHFLKQFYGFTHSIQLRNMYLRWNLARNYTIDGSAIADTFEVKTLTPFSVAASKDVIRDPLPLSPCSSSFSSSEEEEKLVRDLIEDCYILHRRSFFGSLPPESSKLLYYASVASSLSYVRLKDLVSRNPNLLAIAVNYINSLLQTKISHHQDYGERELLLPLILMLREFLSMIPDVNYNNICKTLVPFYMWPVSHSENVKKVMDILKLETKVKGTTYRRTLLMEHDLGLKLKQYNPKSRSVILLVDTSQPESLGDRFYESFVYHQEKPSIGFVKKLLLRSVLHCAPPVSEVDTLDLDSKLTQLTEEQVTQLCEEGVDITEEAVAMETVQEAEQFLISEIGKLSQKLSTLAKASEDEQRDSAFSCGSDERSLPSFPLPPPYMPVYKMESPSFANMLDRLKEMLQRIQYTDQAYNTTQPELSTFTRPDLSQTSLDSTGSVVLEQYEMNGRDLTKSPSELTSISERLNISDEQLLRPISPTARSDPGTNMLQVHHTSNGGTKLTRMLSPQADFPNRDAISDNVSRTSADRRSYMSESVIARPKLERRYTTDSTSIAHSAYRRSTFSKSGTFSAVSPTSASGTGSIRGVKQRAAPSNSLRLKSRRNQSLISTLRGTKAKSKTLKLVLVGDDDMISNTAKAFTELRSKEPNLFWNLDVEFNYIPLSQASSAWAEINRMSGASLTLSDLPEPANEPKNGKMAGDVLIGRYVSHMDSWYEQNVMLAVHNILRLLPNDSAVSHRPPSFVENLDTRWNFPPTPSRLLIDLTCNYIREACHSIRVKMFRVKMTLRSEKSVKGFDHREMFMFHKLDIQRLTGKKSSRQAKPYETSIAMTELSLDNSFIRGELTQMKDVWIIRGSNIPHPTDLGVSNPENECLELTIMKCQTEGGRLSSTKYRATEDSQHHVYEFVVEAKDKPLSVIIDDDVINATENVIRVEVSPASLDQSIVESMQRRTERHERQMHFPIMTFWQVDL